jgi:hypothetical protein
MITVANSCYTEIVRSGVVAVTGLEHKPNPLDPDRSLVLRIPLWLGGLPNATGDMSGSVVYQLKKTPIGAVNTYRSRTAQEVRSYA